MARQGVSKEAYLQVAGATEEELAQQAESEAEQTLKREAVLAAVVDAEQIEPTDEQVLEALAPSAERNKTTPQKLFKQLESSGRLLRVRNDLASRQALELLVEQAKPISVEQAQAREQLWTPEQRGESGSASEQLWTPVRGGALGAQLWRPRGRQSHPSAPGGPTLAATRPPKSPHRRKRNVAADRSGRRRPIATFGRNPPRKDERSEDHEPTRTDGR